MNEKKQTPPHLFNTKVGITKCNESILGTLIMALQP
jgi:hypothetical protein